jgi:glycerate kinase
MYLTVQERTALGLKVKDQNGRAFEVRGKELIENTMASASQFETEQTVTKTLAAEKLINAGDVAFTVNFDKQDGANRTMVARLTDTENYMGRSNVVDLEHSGAGSPNRQVDHRTIKFLILRGVKYNVK